MEQEEKEELLKLTTLAQEQTCSHKDILKFITIRKVRFWNSLQLKEARLKKISLLLRFRLRYL